VEPVGLGAADPVSEPLGEERPFDVVGDTVDAAVRDDIAGRGGPSADGEQQVGARPVRSS
jgi:hypothetical protein